MKVTLDRVCDPIEGPGSQRQTKGKVLEDEYPVVQDEGQVAVEQPTDGDVEECVLQIQGATPHGFHDAHGDGLNGLHLEVRDNQAIVQT